MAGKGVERQVEDGRFAYLEPRAIGLLLDDIQKRAGTCISCESTVSHPIDIDHLVDRYTRADSTDGVSVPVKVRGVELPVDICRVCSDVQFDMACVDLGIDPVTDVSKRLMLTRDSLEAAIRDREVQLSKPADKDSLANMPLPVSPLYGSRRDREFKKHRNKVSQVRQRDMVSGKAVSEAASRKALSALRKKLEELERLNVEGVPDENVPRICARTRERILAARYAPVSLLARDFLISGTVEHRKSVSKFGHGEVAKDSKGHGGKKRVPLVQ